MLIPATMLLARKQAAIRKVYLFGGYGLCCAAQALQLQGHLHVIVSFRPLFLVQQQALERVGLLQAASGNDCCTVIAGADGAH